MLCLALGALLFTFGCKGVNNGGGQGEKKIASYKVEHLQENKDDDEYTTYETEEKKGEVGKSTNAQAKSYDGFIAQPFSQSLVNVDGSTIVQIKYKRKITSIILNLDGGEAETKLENGEGGNKVLRGKYNAKVEVKGLKKEGYVCEKWEPPLPLSFPIKDDTEHIYTAKWQNAIQINIIEGDERLTVISPVNIAFNAGMSWADIKEKMAENVSLKTEWQGGDYELYDWRCENDEGEEITDERIVKNGMKVYPRSNYARFKWSQSEPTACEGYAGKTPKGRIIVPKKTTKISGFLRSELTAVDFRACSELVEVDLSWTTMTSIDLSTCPKVKKINFSYCTKLESANLAGCIELKTISTYFNGGFYHCSALKTVSLAGCIELTEIDLRGITAITSIDLSGCSNLPSIDFSEHTELASVNLTGCSGLAEVKLGYTAITSIDLSGCSNLTKIDFGGCTKLKSANLTGCSKLKTISTGYGGEFRDCNALETVNLKDCSELISVELNSTAITSIDLSTCLKVKRVSFKNCTKLESVNLEGCEALASIDRYSFDGSIEAEVKLPLSITKIGKNAFGVSTSSYCKKVLVPNTTIKQLVIDSKYPASRIEEY